MSHKLNNARSSFSDAVKLCSSTPLGSTNQTLSPSSTDFEYSISVLDGDNVWFVEPKGVDEQSFTASEKEDLALLSLCDNHIISNSSYSWWGAFLSKTNPNKKVVCPTNYVKPNHGSSWINGNYYPPNWYNIDN